MKRLTPHGLRHTCATVLLEAGERVKVVSELLGHSSSQMTLDTYSHVMPSHDVAVTERLGAALIPT